MKDIRFIPENFNSLNLGYYETQMNECSPGYPYGIHSIAINSITINIPKQIILNMTDSVHTPIVPVCAAYMITLKRGLKYNNLSAKLIHIKHIDEDTIYTGEIVKKISATPVPPPNYNEQHEKRQQMINEAQQYSDDELNEGQAGGGFININLMEYVDMPFVPGKYEVWLSFSGLESNYMIIDIVLDE